MYYGGSKCTNQDRNRLNSVRSEDILFDLLDHLVNDQLYGLNSFRINGRVVEIENYRFSDKTR